MQGVSAAQRCSSGSRPLHALATSTQCCPASRVSSALWGSQLPSSCHVRKTAAVFAPTSPASRLRAATAGASGHGRCSAVASSSTASSGRNRVLSSSSSHRTRDSTAIASSSSASSSSSVSAGTAAVRSRSRRLSGPNVIEFSANLETNIPLKQHPNATFDEYLTHSDRVFEAFFPDKERCAKVGKHTWRIFMLPIEFFLLSVHPVVDMDIVLDPRPNRTAYRGANSVIHLNSTRWELQGVDYNPSEFLLSLAGSLYATHSLAAQGPQPGQGPQAPGAGNGRAGAGVARPQARSTAASFASTSTTSSSSSASSSSSSSSASVYPAGASTGAVSSLRGKMSASVALVAPGILAALPQGTISSVGSMVLTRLLGAMKDKVNSRVVSDYKAFVLQKTGARL